jgi:hypothetical protein
LTTQHAYNKGVGGAQIVVKREYLGCLKTGTPNGYTRQ